MFDVILFTDTAEFGSKTRGYGCHRLATHIRGHGYTCLVIDFSSAIDFEDYKSILECAVGSNTLMVGFSTNWFPYKLIDEQPQIVDPGRTFKDDDLKLFNHKTLNSLTNAFAYNQLLPWVEEIKKHNENTKIVLGGTKVDMYMSQPLVDHIIIGYSETMVIDLLDSLSKKTRRLFGKIIDHDQKAQAPVWDFRLSKTQYTPLDFILPHEALALEIGRGCRFKCAYCSYPMIGQRNTVDYLKHEHVLREELLENYENWGTTQYYIIDDTFNDSREKLDMLKRVLDSLPFKIKFWCYIRIDLLATHPEHIPLLLELGLVQCYIGLETFHSKASKAIGKGMSGEKRKETLKKCKDVWGDNVHIQAGFMIGLPHEPSSSIAETSAYLKSPESCVDEPWMFPLSIAGRHEKTKYMYKSDMDANYEKYGYYFKDPNRFWAWSKDDDTDIPNVEMADIIASRYDPHEFRRPWKGDWYRSCLNHPILRDRDRTLAMSDKEYRDLIESIDLFKLYRETVVEEYITPLLKKLKSKARANNVINRYNKPKK